MKRIKIALRLLLVAGCASLAISADIPNASAWRPSDDNYTTYCSGCQYGYFQCYTPGWGWYGTYYSNTPNFSAGSNGSCYKNDYGLRNWGTACLHCDVAYIYYGANYTGAYTRISKGWTWEDPYTAQHDNGPPPTFALGSGPGLNQYVWAGAGSMHWGG